MKHRLVRAPLTLEDSEIWARVGIWPGFSNGFALEDVSRLQDSRDAALMWSMVGIARGFSLYYRHEILGLYFADPFCGLLS